jgi:hypothetical protein
MHEFFYRYRSSKALLGPFAELERQEIFFASPNELNDPLEGARDIFWRGDAILWKNLINHYLLCLTNSVILTRIVGPEVEFISKCIEVFCIPGNLPAESHKALFKRIAKLFWSHSDTAIIPAALETRNAGIRRGELVKYIELIHPHALNSVFLGMEEVQLITRDPGDSIRQASKIPIPFRALVESMGKLEENHPGVPYIAESVCAAGDAILGSMLLSFRM